MNRFRKKVRRHQNTPEGGGRSLVAQSCAQSALLCGLFFVSFSVAYVRTNPRLTTFQEDRNTEAPGSVGIQRFESVVEVDYSAQFVPRFAVRPNL